MHLIREYKNFNKACFLICKFKYMIKLYSYIYSYTFFIISLEKLL